MNQTLFLSDAPNPVSMKQITGKTYDLSVLEKEVADIIEHRLERINDKEQRIRLHDEFMKKLWRGDGQKYAFVDTATGENFMASIESIALHGPISLGLADGTVRTYAFKEVSFQ